MLLYLCSDSNRRWRGLLSRLRGEAFLQEQGDDVGTLIAADELSTDGALGALGFAGTCTILASYKSLHKTGVAEEVTFVVLVCPSPL